MNVDYSFSISPCQSKSSATKAPVWPYKWLSTSKSWLFVSGMNATVFPPSINRCAVLDIDLTESLTWCRSEAYGTFSSTMLTGSSFPRKLEVQTPSLTLKYCGAVQRRKWSPTAYDPQTGNDPRCGTQMIPPEKGGMAWSLISWILLFIY